MKWSDFKIIFPYALRDVLRSKMVFFLTIVSLSVIFTAVFLTGGILEGFGNSLSVTQTDAIGELVIVPRGDDSKIENPAAVAAELKGVGNVKAFSPRVISYSIVTYKEKTIGPHTAIGIDVGSETQTTILQNKMLAGRFLQEGDSKNIMLGATLADALVGLEYDDKRAEIGDYVELTSPSGNKWKYKIVGIVDAKTFFSNWMVFMTADELKSFSNFNGIGQIVVKLEDLGKMEETKKNIKKENISADVQTWEEQAGFIADIILVFGVITGGIISGLSLAVFMVTAVILYINFLQYRRQIGILKSMGVSNYFIIFVYMTEAFIFATLSFGIAFAIFYLLNMNSNQNPIPLLIGDFHTALNLNNISLTFLTLIISAIAGSVIPAVLAAKTNIIDIIRDA